MESDKLLEELFTNRNFKYLQSKMDKEKKKKGKKDFRFDLKNDPRFFPVDGRVPIKAKFAEMFDDDFQILRLFKNY